MCWLTHLWESLYCLLNIRMNFLKQNDNMKISIMCIGNNKPVLQNNHQWINIVKPILGMETVRHEETDLMSHTLDWQKRQQLSQTAVQPGDSEYQDICQKLQSSNCFASKRKHFIGTYQRWVCFWGLSPPSGATPSWFKLPFGPSVRAEKGGWSLPSCLPAFPLRANLRPPSRRHTTSMFLLFLG